MGWKALSKSINIQIGNLPFKIIPDFNKIWMSGKGGVKDNRIFKIKLGFRLNVIGKNVVSWEKNCEQQGYSFSKPDVCRSPTLILQWHLIAMKCALPLFVKGKRDYIAKVINDICRDLF